MVTPIPHVTVFLERQLCSTSDRIKLVKIHSKGHPVVHVTVANSGANISTRPSILILYVACTRHFTHNTRTRETDEDGMYAAFLAKICETFVE